jgi:hypothetical protein
MGSRKAKPYQRAAQKGRKAIRLCRSCGKNAYPNYFFCPACHHKVSGREDPEDSFASGFPAAGFGSGQESRPP